MSEVAINEKVRLDRDGAVAIVTVASPPVNALSFAVRDGVHRALTEALGDDAVRAIVILCEGRTFFAGADITEFGKPPQSPTLLELLDHIEKADRPVIAAIHGTALGGGLELALVCHHRIAVPSAKLGLPEVNLGLLPGAGGTQRLPRVVGVRKALDMICGGRPVSAGSAEKMGLVDRLVDEKRLREDAAEFAQDVIAKAEAAVPIRDRDAALEEARADPSLFDDYRAANARKFRGLEAPEAIIRCVEAATRLPFDEGMTFERARFRELLASPQSSALRYMFFAERQAGRRGDIADDVEPRDISRVGVIGAGTMGGGIAMSFLNAGIPVTIVEQERAALDRGLATIRKNYDRTAAKGKIAPEAIGKRMEMLQPSLDLGDLSEVDLVIEAVFEDIDVKRSIFERLDAIAEPGTILATNTSYLDIDEIAAAIKRPSDVVGLHFFSPANVMKLLEIVRTKDTADDVVLTAQGLAKRIGKIGVTVGNGFGFVGNRILNARNIQADRLILEGATPEQVDAALVEFGFPMGHFQMRDLVGLDVGWDREKSSSATVREILNEMGRHGQKSGSGYYDYDDNRKSSPSAAVQDVIERFAEREKVTRRELGKDEILERMLLAMVNEGAKILDEGIARSASDIDVTWVTGYGWPRYRGGPMYWADSQGIDHVLDRLRALQSDHGDAFAPASLITELAESGRSFTDKP